jgi:tetratricopeptide (TPR) repeat protein
MRSPIDSSFDFTLISIKGIMRNVKEVSQEELKALREKYENLLAENPSSGAFVFLAEVLIKCGEVERAVSVLTEGLKHNPQNVTAKFILGKILYDRGMVEQAKKEMEEIVQSAPDNVAASKILIQIYRMEGKPEKALDVAQSVSFFLPGDDEIREVVEGLKKEIAVAEERKKEELLESIGEQEDESLLFESEIYTETMADLYMNQGLYEEAIRVFEKLLEIGREGQSIHTKLARARAYLLSEKAGFTTKR